jgi:hypothetical protein
VKVNTENWIFPWGGEANGAQKPRGQNPFVGQSDQTQTIPDACSCEVDAYLSAQAHVYGHGPYRMRGLPLYREHAAPIRHALHHNGEGDIDTTGRESSGSLSL